MERQRIWLRRHRDNKNKSFPIMTAAAEEVAVMASTSRDGEVTFETELSYCYSYFSARNFGTIVASVTVTTLKIR